MDRKSIIVVAGCFVLLLLWSNVIFPKLYPPRPKPILQSATNTITTTQTLESTNVAGTSTGTIVSATAPAATPVLNINTNIAEEVLVVANDDARYTFTSRG